jgi:hypothetical protein
VHFEVVSEITNIEVIAEGRGPRPVARLQRRRVGVHVSGHDFLDAERIHPFVRLWRIVAWRTASEPLQ